MIYLIIIVILLAFAIIFQTIYILNIKNKLKRISNILDEIKAGNLDRRLYANQSDPTSDLVYKINEIVIQDKNEIMELKKAAKTYRELVTNLSHDIRTPLTSIIGYIDVLEQETVSLTEQSSFLNIAKKKALGLSEYIQLLFDWLKLESGEWIYRFEQENICELTRVILSDWIHRLEENNIQFRFDIPKEALNISLDKRAYERVIDNLLSNAIKHSKADTITFVLSLKDDCIVIDVSDNGVGIDPIDLPFIFDRLYKCDSARSVNSNGLGLAIAKELVSALGGEIYADSQLNIGTSFHLKFNY